MRFADSVTIQRPSGEDEYGNPSRDFTTPTETTSAAYVVSDTLALLPASADVQTGDRLLFGSALFSVEASLIRSPSKSVLYSLALQRITD